MALVQLGFFEEFANVSGQTAISQITSYVNDKFSGQLYRPAFSVGNSGVLFTKTEITSGTDNIVRPIIRGRNNSATTSNKIFYTGLRIENLTGQTGRYVFGCRLKRTNVVTPTVYPCGFTQDGVRTMLSATAETELYLEVDLNFESNKLQVYVNGTLSTDRDLNTSTSNAAFEVYLGSVQTSSGEGYAMLQDINDELEISDYYLIRDESGSPLTPRLGPIVIDKRVATSAQTPEMLSAITGNVTATGSFSNGTYTLGTTESFAKFDALPDTVAEGMEVVATTFQVLAGRGDPTSPAGILVTAEGRDGASSYPVVGQMQKELGNIVRSPGQFIITQDMISGGSGYNLRKEMDYFLKATK